MLGRWVVSYFVWAINVQTSRSKSMYLRDLEGLFGRQPFETVCTGVTTVSENEGE